MKPDHRRYHLDVLAGVHTGSVKFQLHRRKIRDAIRQGTHELRGCSVSYDDGDFLPGEKAGAIARDDASRPPRREPGKPRSCALSGRYLPSHEAARQDMFPLLCVLLEIDRARARASRPLGTVRWD